MLLGTVVNGAIVGAAWTYYRIIKKKNPLSKFPMAKGIDFLTIRKHFVIRSINRSS